MNWNILGIEPTKDKKAIVTAYRTRLVQVNPEDKPEEFKALRSAYEEAMKYADSEDAAPVRDESPVGLWMERVRELYSDFPSRVRPERWREVLADDVCAALDTRPLAEEALLRFLMEDYFIPQSVWRVLDEVFSLAARQTELYESYPRDFIDYAVMNGIKLSPNLPYELFIPGQNAKDCDEYRRLYHKANSCPPEERAAVLDQMDALSERHPHGDALRCLLLLEQGEADRGREGLQALAERYPDDEKLLMLCAQVCGDSEAAERLVRHVLDLNPQHMAAKRLLAGCLADNGQYQDAKDLVFELLRSAGGDQVQAQPLQALLQKWNEELIRQGEVRLAADPSDSENARELAWCYMQNDDLESAMRVSAFVDPEKEQPYDYHNLMGKLHYGMEDYAAAVNHMLAVEDLLRQAKTDPNHHAAKYVYRLPEFLQITGSCLMNLGRTAEAVSRYEESLALSPEDPSVLDHMGRLYAYQKEYEKAADMYARLIRLMPNGYHGYLMLAMNLYELRRDREAFDAVNRALDLQGSDLGVYVLKMRILLRNGVWDEVRRILDFLTRSKVGDEITVCWCHALLTELADRDKEKAMEEYRAIAARMDGGEHLPWGDELYYRMTVLTGEKLDARKAEDRLKMLDLLDKGLEINPDNQDCLDYKAWLYRKGGYMEDALAIYQKMAAKPVHSLNAERGIADIYYDDLAHHADKALEYYRLLLRHRESPDLHFYSATCLRYMGDLEAAEAHFLKEQELDPADVDGYNGLAFVYEAMGRNEDALAQVEKAIACVEGREGSYSWLYNHKSQILRRMDRPKEAIAAQDEALKRYDHKGAYKNRFEICCQFGLWDQAKTMLDEWIQSRYKPEQYGEAAVMFQLYQGKMMKATMSFANYVRLIGDYRQDELKMVVADLEGNPERGLKVWTARYPKDPDSTRTVGCLAHRQWLCGLREEAKQTAEKLLAMLDGKLAGNTVNEALYRTQRTRPLAMLGRMEEARAELEKARSIPLCENCVYGSCKDADVFEAELEEIAGNYGKALELFRKAMAKWPDELDLAAGAARLKKRGKK